MILATQVVTPPSSESQDFQTLMHLEKEDCRGDIRAGSVGVGSIGRPGLGSVHGRIDHSKKAVQKRAALFREVKM